MSETLKLGNGNWATKKESLLAYNSENNNFKPLPFNFTRDSIATRVNKEGLIEVVGNDIPRIDYTDSAEGSLLLEPARTNLITYSEDFSQPSWSKAGLTVNVNQIVSPDGSLNADEVDITAPSAHFLFNVISVSASTNYTFTFYAKKGTATDVSYSIYDSTNNADIVASTSYYSQISNTNWTRITVKFTTPSNCTSVRTYPVRDGSSDGTVYLWGAQVEQQSYATSYIPTSGSTVPRSAETCNNSGNSEVFNDSEGVLMAEVNFNEEQTTSRYISINDGGSSDRVLFGVTSNTSNLKGFVYQNNQTPYLINTDININYVQKIALLYKTNLIQLYLNGFKIDEITTAVMPTGLNKLSFNDSVTADFYGKTKQISYYDTALTDEELEYMTSYRSLNELVTELNLNEL